MRSIIKMANKFYDLVFKERFMGSEKKVKCVIMQELIKKCKYGRK